MNGAAVMEMYMSLSRLCENWILINLCKFYTILTFIAWFLLRVDNSRILSQGQSFDKKINQLKRMFQNFWQHSSTIFKFRAFFWELKALSIYIYLSIFFTLVGSLVFFFYDFPDSIRTGLVGGQKRSENNTSGPKVEKENGRFPSFSRNKQGGKMTYDLLL